jgi:hypothetical protein
MHFASNFPKLSEFFVKKAQFDLNQSGTNTSEIESGIGDSGIVAKALELARQFGDFSEIKYIGVTGDPGVLGLASTEYNNQLLQDLINKTMQAQNQNLSDSDRQKIDNIRVSAERLYADKRLVAFQLNPEKIIETADFYLEGIVAELKQFGKTSEEICQKDIGSVRKDIITIILSSVMIHEKNHSGSMDGEGPSSAAENAFLHQAFRDTSTLPEYNYLGNFQIIQRNIQ